MEIDEQTLDKLSVEAARTAISHLEFPNEDSRLRELYAKALEFKVSFINLNHAGYLKVPAIKQPLSPESSLFENQAAPQVLGAGKSETNGQPCKAGEWTFKGPGFGKACEAPVTRQPDEYSPLLPPWFDITTAPMNGATVLGMYAAKESYLGDDGPRHHIVRWFDSEAAFCTTDGRGEPERRPTLTHWQPLTYLHSLYGHVIYPVPGAYYAYDLPTAWNVEKTKEESE